MKDLVRAYAREEDGSLLIFAVYVFVLILMVGGIGVDLMRFERDRADLQYTLDRAVLAAADLDQTLDPSAVVADYLSKAGLGDSLASVSVSEGLGFRAVTASATAEVRTQFMHMTGIDVLDAPATSAAEERIDGIEISLVLDVSGSMNSNSRLTNLKSAGRDFIDNMVDNTQDGKLSISIIPYATQVSTPAAFLDEFNVSDEHEYSNCVNFESSDFSNTGINTGQDLERTMHFSPWGNGDGRDNSPKELVNYPVCDDRTSREMLIMQKDRNTLKNFITNLSAWGNTSIDLGMKWGTALLDQSVQPVITELISDGLVSSDFSQRPHAYDSDETLKVVVLMTDGQNTSQYYIEDDFRTGDSDVWWNDVQQHYSVYYSGYSAYFWPHTGQWADHPYGLNGYGCIWNNGWNCGNQNQPGESARLSYADLWAYTSLQANVEDNYEPWMNDNQAWNEWYYDVYGSVGSSTKNSRTNSICSAAKDQGIIVFTIGFEAPSSGQTVLKNCASSASHYFDVDGLEISDAFVSIASSIRKLRLTQ
ncbi:MAG: pilus assembly protein TadG-related protein [Sedimentitalea sp.]